MSETHEKLGELAPTVRQMPRPRGAEHQRLKNLLRQQLFGAAAPEKIGRFEIRRQLGMGGMGVVYACYDRQLDRELAVKLIRDVEGQNTSGRQARLMREAQAMARLSHPHVVSIYEVGRHEAEVYVAMEMVAGETLRNWQRRQRFSFCVALYEALYQQRPFAGRNLQEIADAVLSERVQQPDDSHAVPTWLRSVLLRGLSASAAERHESMDELLLALAHDQRQRQRQRRGLVLGGAALLSLGAALGAVVLMATDDQPGPCQGIDQSLADIWSPARAPPRRSVLRHRYAVRRFGVAQRRWRTL